MDGNRPCLSKIKLASMRGLIESCWDVEPSNRPLFSCIVKVLRIENALVNGDESGGVGVGLAQSKAMSEGTGLRSVKAASFKKKSSIVAQLLPTSKSETKKGNKNSIVQNIKQLKTGSITGIFAARSSQKSGMVESDGLKSPPGAMRNALFDYVPLSRNPSGPSRIGRAA